MRTRFGELEPGEYEIDGFRVVVTANGWTETPLDVASEPRTLWPYEFQELLTDDQLVAIQASMNPIIIRMRTKVQTIVSPMPFDEGTELYNGVLLLGQLKPEQFPPEEVQRILEMRPPER